jgi:hypothetical protein
MQEMSTSANTFAAVRFVFLGWIGSLVAASLLSGSSFFSSPGEYVHYARKQMKVLMNNNCEL